MLPKTSRLWLRRNVRQTPRAASALATKYSEQFRDGAKQSLAMYWLGETPLLLGGLVLAPGLNPQRDQEHDNAGSRQLENYATRPSSTSSSVSA
jgi:hypothetical protein